MTPTAEQPVPLEKKLKVELSAPPMTDTQKKLLQKLYFDELKMMGRDALFQYVSTHYPKYEISRRQVWDFIKSQNISQLYRQTRKSKDIKPTVNLKRPYAQMAIDLTNMMDFEDKDGYIYILTMVDLFSKKLWASAIQNKEGSTVAKAFDEMVTKIPHKIATIRSDVGSEFVSDDFQKVLEKHHIKQILSAPSKPWSNGGIERMNGILKRQLKMYCEQFDTNEWVEKLQTIVDNINEMKSRITKKTPNEIDATADHKNNIEADIHKAEQNEVNENIKNAVLKDGETEDENVLKVGDIVRLKLETDDKQKNNELWTKKLFTVRKVFKSNKPYTRTYYYVSDEDGTDYTDKLYWNDLQKITAVENPIEEPETYDISHIISRRKVRGTADDYEYLVHWTGYSRKDQSYVPENDLKRDTPKLLKAFKEKHNYY